MIKWFLTILLMVWVSTAFAANTWYVRVAGGSSTQCTGLTNADYPGTGLNQACAFNHPSWVMGAGNTGLWAGGDTMMIDDSSSAQYKIGYGMPGAVGCSLFYPYSCILNAIPSGTDVNHPTRILGSSYNTGCATKPQLWGTESTGDATHGIFQLSGKNNIDIECLEITDHSSCGFRVGANKCTENYGSGTSSGTYIRGPAIYAYGGTNFIFKNLDIHGLAGDGVHMGGVNGITWSHVNMDGNHGAGWNGDVGESGTESSMSGTILVDHVKVRFSGCAEAYPRSGSFSAADYTDCADSPTSGAYGDGWGFYNTAGTWIITNSEWSHNSSDGLDLLYGQNALDLSIDKSLFEGNNGNQLKFTARNMNLTNSILIGNCNYQLSNNKIYDPATTLTCRANGTPISATTVLGSNWKIYNNTGYSATGSGGSPFIEVIDRNGSCNGTETYTYKNNVLVSNHSATNWVPYYSSLSGVCATPWNAATTDHSVIYNFNSNPSGIGNVFTSPLFSSAINAGSTTNVSNITLQSGSPGKGTAASGVSFWNSSTDYNNFLQNSPVDMGAIQFGSSATLTQAGQTCVATSDCAAGTCSNFTCSGSCTANGGACSSGATCCSATCTASVCAVASTCGDNVIQPGEICDGTALNGSTCVLQGFTGGTLACAANCLSYNTASCTNTTVFPLTPLIDTFTRADSTGLGSNWTVMNTGINISGNTAIGATNSQADNRDYWNASTFNADEEVYATISSKGATTGDSVNLYLRMNQAALNAYYVQYNENTSGNDTIILKKWTAGSGSTLATYTQEISAGDSIGLSAVGSALTVYYKSGSGAWASKGATTDTTYSTGGVVSIATGFTATSPKITNFGGGSLNPVTCGNGLKETGEACDGSDLAGQLCTTQGFASGTLTCASNCQSFVTSSCVAATCGNNTKEVGEVCDGTDINSQTCAGLGFISGSVTCNTGCQTFNTSSCVGRTGSSGRGFASNRGFAI